MLKLGCEIEFMTLGECNRKPVVDGFTIHDEFYRDMWEINSFLAEADTVPKLVDKLMLHVKKVHKALYELQPQYAYAIPIHKGYSFTGVHLHIQDTYHMDKTDDAKLRTARDIGDVVVSSINRLRGLSFRQVCSHHIWGYYRAASSGWKNGRRFKPCLFNNTHQTYELRIIDFDQLLPQNRLQLTLLLKSAFNTIHRSDSPRDLELCNALKSVGGDIVDDDELTAYQLYKDIQNAGGKLNFTVCEDSVVEFEDNMYDRDLNTTERTVRYDARYIHGRYICNDHSEPTPSVTGNTSSHGDSINPMRIISVNAERCINVSNIRSVHGNTTEHPTVLELVYKNDVRVLVCIPDQHYTEIKRLLDRLIHGRLTVDSMSDTEHTARLLALGFKKYDAPIKHNNIIVPNTMHNVDISDVVRVDQILVYNNNDYMMAIMQKESGVIYTVILPLISATHRALIGLKSKLTCDIIEAMCVDTDDATYIPSDQDLRNAFVLKQAGLIL